jgi:hypothetical protein
MGPKGHTPRIFSEIILLQTSVDLSADLGQMRIGLVIYVQNELLHLVKRQFDCSLINLNSNLFINKNKLLVLH